MSLTQNTKFYVKYFNCPSANTREPNSMNDKKIMYKMLKNDVKNIHFISYSNKLVYIYIYKKKKIK